MDRRAAPVKMLADSRFEAFCPAPLDDRTRMKRSLAEMDEVERMG